MPNHPCRTPRRIRKPRCPLQPRILKPRHSIDRIKQPQKPHSLDWSRKRLPKRLHIVVHLLLLPLPPNAMVIVRAHLPLAERLPREMYHLLISLDNESDMVEHFAEKA